MARTVTKVLLLLAALGGVITWCLWHDTPLKEMVFRLSNGRLTIAVNEGGFYINCYLYYKVRLATENRWLIDFPPGARLPKVLRLSVESWPEAHSPDFPSAVSTRRLWFYSPVGTLWLFVVLFCIYPTIAFVRGPVRRWRRLRTGRCVRCGYNLAGNVSGRCPECGTEINKADCPTTGGGSEWAP